MFILFTDAADKCVLGKQFDPIIGFASLLYGSNHLNCLRACHCVLCTHTHTDTLSEEEAWSA